MSLTKTAKNLPLKHLSKPKAEVHEVEFPGVRDFAEVSAMIDVLTKIKKGMESDLKAQGFETYLGLESDVYISSYRAVEEGASCTVEMRKRSTASALDDGEVVVLTKMGLQPPEHVTTPSLYAINPKYVNNDSLMKKVGDVLVDIVPADFFIHQEEKSAMIVDESLHTAAYNLPFGSRDRAVALQICSTVALRPRLGQEYDMGVLVKNLTKFLTYSSEHGQTD